jgi:ABC-2 type transport system ATP-binding protein
MNQAILNVQQLSKKYKQQQALDDINLTINKGEIVGLAGPNGAGKTTLFKIITGLIPQYEGAIQLFSSTNKQELVEYRKYVGAIIENPAFIPEMTAYQNMKFYQLQRGITDEEKIPALLDLVNLQDTGKKKFKNFSLGMKQRLAIAATLLHQPEFLILDEPTNGLDPSGIIEIRQLLKKLAKEKQTTIFISSHILSELENLATRFIIINHGQIIEQFTKKELQQRMQNYYEITTPTPEKALTIIEQVFQTKDYEIDEEGRIHFYAVDIPLEDINEVLVKNDVKVSQLIHKQYELESLYMNLTEGGGVDA